MKYVGMKKTKGKVSRDRSTVRINLSGSSLKPGAISFTIKGIKISAIINKVKRKINNEEKIKEKNSSDLFFPNLLLIHAVRWNPASQTKLDKYFRFLERTTSFLIDFWITNSEATKKTLVDKS